MYMRKDDQQVGGSQENQTTREQVESELKLELNGSNQNE